MFCEIREIPQNIGNSVVVTQINLLRYVVHLFDSEIMLKPGNDICSANCCLIFFYKKMNCMRMNSNPRHYTQ